MVEKIKTGSLCNLTEGGTGGYGYKHTEEAKQKMKNRAPHNKGVSKWSLLEKDIFDDIQNGFTERQIIKKYSCSSGVIYRIKKQYTK